LQAPGVVRFSRGVFIEGGAGDVLAPTSRQTDQTMNEQTFKAAGIDPGTKRDRAKIYNAQRNGESLAFHAMEAFLELNPPTADELENLLGQGTESNELHAAWLLGMLMNEGQITQALHVWRCAELHLLRQDVPHFTLSDVVQLCTMKTLIEWKQNKNRRENDADE
jgi:hypothetical protein